MGDGSVNYLTNINAAAVADQARGDQLVSDNAQPRPIVTGSLATLVSGRARHVRRQGRAIVVSVAVWGGAIVVLGFATAVPVALAALAVAGAGDMVSGIFRTAILRSAVEDRLRGRLDGIGMAVWASGPALGNLESGAVAAVAGIPFAVVSGGVLSALGVVALAVLAPAFWRYDARPSAA